MPTAFSLRGIIAATFTPFDLQGDLSLNQIKPMVDFLVQQMVNGLYVLGSTGEGLSLTIDERKRTLEAFVEAAGGRIPVIVQVGCESLRQAKELALHAQQCGADAVSAVCPVYFKPSTVRGLVDCMHTIASGAPRLPFYYYHIPMATGVALPIVETFKTAFSIDNFAGMKFTATSVHEYQACVELADNQYQVLWGLDEMLLAGLTAGATAAVGSTYNFAAPVYHRLLRSYANGDLESARREQAMSQAIVRAFVPHGPRAAQKAIMSLIGQDCGPTRLPIEYLNPMQIQSLRNDLEAVGFFQSIAAETI